MRSALGAHKKERSLFEYCAELCVILDGEHTWWRDCFDGDDVAEWLAERWPLRPADLADSRSVALACLSDLEESLFESMGDA